MHFISKMMDRAVSGGCLRGFLASLGEQSNVRVSHTQNRFWCDSRSCQGIKINLNKCEIFPVGEVQNIEGLDQVFNYKV